MQTFRATFVTVITIPVCLLGSFIIMSKLNITLNALRSDGTVLVVREGKVEQTKVQLAATKGEESFLTGGVNEGDLVVVSGGRKLKTGDRVTYAGQ